MDNDKEAFAIKLGKVLKTKRVELGYSQQNVADMTGISLQHISMIENGARTLSAYYLAKLINALKLSITEIYPCIIINLENENQNLHQNFADLGASLNDRELGKAITIIKLLLDK